VDISDEVHWRLSVLYSPFC